MTVNKNRAGFSLLELLIAILIIGVISAAVIPQLMNLQIGRERKEFISKLSSLTQLGWQQAVASQTVHRITFDINSRTATLEKSTIKKQKETFTAMSGSYLPTTMSWPATIEIKQFIIEGYDEMQRFTRSKTETVWFYLIPDGMIQQVVINFIDKEQLIDGKPMQVGLVLNPFTASFKVYDVFQK